MFAIDDGEDLDGFTDTDDNNDVWSSKLMLDSGLELTPGEQYKLSVDGVKNKYARVPDNDKDRAEPVTWPPTRRALMADMLKK